MDQYLTAALKAGMDDAILIQTSEVYTAPWVRLKCQFGCGRYSKSHCCPPHTPLPDEMRRILDSYTQAILLHRNWKEGALRIDAFNEAVVALEKSLFLDGCYKALGLGSGPCMLCEKCNISGQCVNSSQARPSMEACGIDVFRSVRKLGLPISVLRDRKQERHSYGLVLVE